MAGGLTMAVNATAFNAELEKKGEDTLEAAQAAVYIEAQSIITDSVPLVPWQTGVLKGSHYVDNPVVEGDSVSVEFGYGGAASAYAVVQHEHEEFSHPRGGQAKYLQQPFEQHGVNIDERLAQHIQTWH